MDDFRSQAMTEALLSAGCSDEQADVFVAITKAALDAMTAIVRSELDAAIKAQPSVASETAAVQDFLGSAVRREVARAIKPRLMMKDLEVTLRRVVQEEIVRDRQRREVKHQALISEHFAATTMKHIFEQDVGCSDEPIAGMQ